MTGISKTASPSENLTDVEAVNQFENLTTEAPPAKTQNKFERIKAEKDGLVLKQELELLASIGWEAIEEPDRDFRLRALGLFYREVTPGRFMLRMRTANGIMPSNHLRVLAEIVQYYGDHGNADITTRQNIQLRGIRIEDAPDIFRRFEQAGMTSVQTGVDNVRNVTGSPVAGLEADELIDTRGLCRAVQDMITNMGAGNSAFTNLPRKFNIAIAGCRDNSVHAETNDLAFIPAYKNDQIGFNVIVCGMFSPKRYQEAVPLNAWVSPDDVVEVCEAVLLIYRNHGLRANRQKSRLMYLIDAWGIEKFRSQLEQHLDHSLEPAAESDEMTLNKRDHIGVYRQKQPGLNYVGLHIPIGRLYAHEMFELARMADVYGSGELRLTVEQNLIIPNVPNSRLDALLKEPLLQERFSIEPDPVSRWLVSCTGNQFCGFALIETKNRALAMVKALEAELTVPQPVRIHWTGCPNSCGQPQVADIGLMGTKARKNGQVVEAVDIWMGGKVGSEACLGSRVQSGIPCDDLLPILRNLLTEHFGAKPRQTGYFVPPDLLSENNEG
ncbi:MAG: ferredoxin--nitrite reductase [Leptolyngbya sp. ERB_1_1]